MLERKQSNPSDVDSDEHVLLVKKVTDQPYHSDKGHTYERLGAGILHYRSLDGDQLAPEKSSFFLDDIPQSLSTAGGVSANDPKDAHRTLLGRDLFLCWRHDLLSTLLPPQV